MKNSIQIVVGLLLIGLMVSCNPSSDKPSNSVSADTDRPSLSGAIAQTNTSILVSFSEPMGQSAGVITHYSIVPDNTNINTGSLDVTEVELAADNRSVILTTLSQGERTYEVTAVNVKDLAGNVIAQAQAGIGVEIDPARARFIGIAPELVETVLIFDEFDQLPGWIDEDGNGEISVGDGLTDSQGNTFILTDNDSNGVIDSWVDADFSGTINAGDSISGQIDSDLDGLLDSQETLGWTVTVVRKSVV